MADAGVRQLRSTLQVLNEWLTTTHTPHLIIGGVAVSLLGRARLTRDVVLVAIVDTDAWPSFLQTAMEFGFVPREPDPLEFARRYRMLLLRHEAEKIDVDISLGCMPFDRQCITRGATVHAGGVALRLPSVADLIIMKAVAFRPVDLADIDTLLDVHPDVDRKHIRKWVRDFADAMDSPDVFEKVDELLRAKRISETQAKTRDSKRQ